MRACRSVRTREPPSAPAASGCVVARSEDVGASGQPELTVNLRAMGLGRAYDGMCDLPPISGLV